MKVLRIFGKSILLVALASTSALSQVQTSSVNTTEYRDLVRFKMHQDVREVRLKVLKLTGQEIFDSDFHQGNTIDWFRRDSYGRSVRSGVYSFVLIAREKSGGDVTQESGSLAIDDAAGGLIEAPPLDVLTSSPHRKGIEPAHAGSFDVDHGTNAYTINTPAMGVGTANPLVRLHVGAGTLAPVTLGAALLVEDGVNTSMVMKSTTGGEMFFFQNNVAGVFGTVSPHPMAIRTNNVDRMWLDTAGNVGIGTLTPGSKLTVSGRIESTSGGFKFPDGTTQTTAATGGGGGSVVHGPTLTGSGTAGSPLNVAVPLDLSSSFAGGIINGRNTTNGYGVYGSALSGFGLYGEITSSVGTGVYGKGPDYGVAGLSTAGTAGFSAGVYGEGLGPDGTGVFGGGLVYGVAGVARSEGGHGVFGQAITGTSGTGVNGMGLTYGVFGFGGTHGGFFQGNIGVLGSSVITNGRGVIAEANNGPTSYGILAKSTSGFAGYFEGKVHVNGTLSKAAGSFRIDHPLDPENKYLSHSFVESPDMMNIYNGNVLLDEDGEAKIELPEWFEALNKSFRYQLTCIGGFAQVYIAEEIVNNSFKISGGRAGLKVSWQVTGVREDPYARKHRIKVEEDKIEQERGFYLHPDLYGKPADKGIEQAHRPDMTPQIQQPEKRRGSN